MNADRRSRIEKAKVEIQDILDAEQSAFDNLPENFQQGEQGDKMQEVINSLEEAVSALEGIEL